MNKRQFLVAAKLFCQNRILGSCIFISIVIVTFSGLYPRLLLEVMNFGKLGDTILNWLSTALAGAALLFAIYCFLYQTKNFTIINIRSKKNRIFKEAWIVQELSFEIQSTREQLYLEKIYVSDPFNRFFRKPISLSWEQNVVFRPEIDGKQILLFPLDEKVRKSLFIEFPPESTEHFLTFSFSDNTRKEIYIRVDHALTKMSELM